MNLRAALAFMFPLAWAAACGGGDNSAAPDVGDGSVVPSADGSGSRDGAASGDDAHSAGDAMREADSAEVDAWTPLPPTPRTPELWYWHHSYLSPGNASEPAHSKALIDQAVAAGYTGLAFWDSSLTFANKTGWDTKNLAAVVNYATSKGLEVLATAAPVGYSNDMLQADPNLAEGQRVVGGQFQVASDGGGGFKLDPINSLPALVNGGFESGQTTWFGIGDARIGVDTTVAHTGSNSATLVGGAQPNARLTQAITLTPWRLYHAQFWFKTQGFSGTAVELKVLDFKTKQNAIITRMDQTVPAGGDQNWTVFDYAFNSHETTDATIYLGLWGPSAGTFWVDDIVVEETALANVLRRGGTPVKVYDSATTYTEGTDYANIVDPALAAQPGHYDPWHAPPTVAVPSGSRLQSGQTVSMDYYTVFPQIGWEVSSCLSEPSVQQWNHDNAAVLKQVFPAGSRVFLGYDEMRQGNSCELCRSKNMTAGQLLADNVRQTVQTLSAVWGAGTKWYFWDDMFSPYHNAVADYYDVDGDLSGSWEGLPPGAIIMQWNLASLGFFTGTDTKYSQPHGFQQIIAGYYDPTDGNGAKAATDELMAAHGMHGVIGLMYTSWADDYSQLKAYADAAQAAWPAYRLSTP